MGKRKLFDDISASTLQVVMNQLAGAIVFFIISNSLDKQGLGLVNWTLAVLTVVFAIAGFGLEHIAVKRSANGDDVAGLLKTYSGHMLIAACCVLVLFTAGWFLFAWSPEKNSLLILLALGQCFSFLSVPFKQIVNGLEKFRALLLMSSVANLVKMTALAAWIFRSPITLQIIAWIYLAAGLLELLICILVYKIRLGLPLVIGFNGKKYRELLRESLPVLGMTIFNTAISRMDWILLGLLSTSLVVAEYSFANRLFELATLPLLVIAPVIFPRISRMFHQQFAGTQLQKMDYLRTLIRLEIIIAVLVMLVMNACWVPVIDFVTGNKYGAATKVIIRVILFAMPLVYINNVCWSILFAQGKTRPLFYLFLFTFLANILADLVLIPSLHAMGAAIGFLLALAVQTGLYMYHTPGLGVRRAAFSLLPVLTAGIAAAGLSSYLVSGLPLQLACIVGIYFALLLLFRQLSVDDVLSVRKLMMP